MPVILITACLVWSANGGSPRPLTSSAAESSVFGAARCGRQSRSRTAALGTLLMSCGWGASLRPDRVVYVLRNYTTPVWTSRIVVCNYSKSIRRDTRITSMSRTQYGTRGSLDDLPFSFATSWNSSRRGKIVFGAMFGPEPDSGMGWMRGRCRGPASHPETSSSRECSN